MLLLTHTVAIEPILKHANTFDFVAVNTGDEGNRWPRPLTEYLHDVNVRQARNFQRTFSPRMLPGSWQ